MTLSKKLLLVVCSFLASLALTACGGEANKVYPEGGNGSQGQNPDGTPSKPEPEAYRFATAQLAGTISVALFQLDRTVDLAFNKSDAESLLNSNDCQVVASNTGANAVAVETSAFACRRASPNSDWAGSERIEMTAGSDNLFQTIKTSTDTNNFELGLRNRDHDVRSRLSLTKASTSRPGNRQTYNFTAFVEIKSESTVTKVKSVGPKPQNGSNPSDDERETSSLKETIFSGKTTVQLGGQIEIDKASKRMVSIHLTEGTLDTERFMERGTVLNKAVSNLILKPSDSSDFADASCGRFKSDFNVNQTLERSLGNRTSPSLERVSVLKFNELSIQSVGGNTIRLGPCKPGFATIATDLDLYASGLFGMFGK